MQGSESNGPELEMSVFCSPKKLDAVPGKKTIWYGCQRPSISQFRRKSPTNSTESCMTKENFEYNWSNTFLYPEYKLIKSSILVGNPRI